MLCENIYPNVIRPPLPHFAYPLREKIRSVSTYSERLVNKRSFFSQGLQGQNFNQSNPSSLREWIEKSQTTL